MIGESDAKFTISANEGLLLSSSAADYTALREGDFSVRWPVHVNPGLAIAAILRRVHVEHPDWITETEGEVITK